MPSGYALRTLFYFGVGSPEPEAPATEKPVSCLFHNFLVSDVRRCPQPDTVLCKGKRALGSGTYLPPLVVIEQHINIFSRPQSIAESACGDLFNALAALGTHHNAAVTLTGINVALNV